MLEYENLSNIHFDKNNVIAKNSLTLKNIQNIWRMYYESNKIQRF
jgi:hypothetical protein